MNGIEEARTLARGALSCLEASRRRIDDLNVYPVPDGDTGTNLTLTVRAVVEALERSGAGSVDAVARELSRAALMGARGNSGVIFSQIVRGFADEVGQASRVDAATLARAFRSASDAAYRAVRRPVEGTMLTVIREMAEEAETVDVRVSTSVELLRRVVARAEDAVRRTPEQLAVLREAGVVDAGGAGLLEIVRGLAAAAAGEAVPTAAAEPAPEISLEAIHGEPSRYRYCTVFVIEGDGLDASSVERQLEALGDSLLVVGDAAALKVHVHTDEPGAALGVGTALGVVEGVEIANMVRQAAERDARLGVRTSVDAPALTTGLVAVVAGAGNRRLFEEQGATRVVEGGPTMNPATADLVAAIEATPAHDVLLLPNNGNVLLAAEQAAGLTDKVVRVLPTTSVQAGLAAMGAFISSLPIEANEDAMLEAIERVAAGEVTRASRDVELDGVAVRKGGWLGLADGTAVICADDFEEVAAGVAERLVADDHAFLTLLRGDDAPDVERLSKRLEAAHPGLAVDVVDGGQPHYPLLLWAE